VKKALSPIKTGSDEERKRWKTGVMSGDDAKRSGKTGETDEQKTAGEPGISIGGKK